MHKLMRWYRKQDGSVTLEAAVFMPIFILFLVFLIYMVRFALTDIALNRATSETAKQIATQVYPVKVVTEKVTSFVGDQYQEIIKDLEDNQQHIEAELVETLGSEGLQLLKDSTGGVISSAQASALTYVVQRHLEEEDRMKIIEADNVEVESAVLPIIDGDSKYVEIVATYELDLPIPFIERTFVLRKKAVERAWLGS
ncbi:TadE/TadG family type IV pilus assembly protein [Amphibacillus jilinensis]|uniref:TadE/TadG family type IV pilus assembly protein n=1 Tax=Amphibacillus jilinensis TaxID=1216008 RepID=UPI0002F83B4E|nr:TadE family protein [Amphibacillus jilinensis]